MATVLVVDDSELERQLAGRLIQKHHHWVGEEIGLTPIYAANGQQALSIVEREAPDLVLTDLQMPEMDGLELVEAIKRSYPSLPVILMTAHGSEEIAVQALQRGANSYVSKQKMGRQLIPTIESLLQMAHASREEQRLLLFLTHREADFSLENDPHLAPALVGYVKEMVSPLSAGDNNEFMRVATALSEAITNAIYHGNLEVSSELREKDDRAYHALAQQRRQQEPYCCRRVSVHIEASREESVYVVSDEGPGFDPSSLPDPTDPMNVLKPSGRGLFLIQTFMDHVQYNSRGNEITLVKKHGS